MLNETYNIVQKVYNTKTGKNPLLIYIDKNTSTEDPYKSKEKFKEYGMEWLPSKLGKYAPYAWGWILWDGEQDKKMSYVKKFVNELPTIEEPEETGNARGFNDITSNLEKTVQEILKNLEAVSEIQTKSLQDANVKQKIDDFKKVVANGLNDENTKKFVENLIKYRTELKKHNAYSLGWTNVLLVYFARGGKATQVRPLKEWEGMGYKPKDGIEPIVLLGRTYNYKRYTKQQKEIIIQNYLQEKGVNSIEDLPQSSLYDLEHRKLKGRPIPGSERQFTYNAYDIMDVEPIPGKQVEKEPDEPEDNWWWDKIDKDEKDMLLTKAIVEFAASDECGNVVINPDNTREQLGGARGNATSSGEINLIDDQYIQFPTAVHELTHQLRHWAFASTNNPALKRFYYRNSNRDIREQEADLCSAFVSYNFGYSIQSRLNYLQNWGLTKDNVNEVFNQIADLAQYIENGVQKYMNKIIN